MTATKIVTPKTAAKDIEKDASMAKQKEMMAAHYDRLTAAPETGAKVCCTFVPGNLNELIMCFGLVNNLPEVNAIQSGLRRLSGNYVLEAEKIGHSCGAFRSSTASKRSSAKRAIPPISTMPTRWSAGFSAVRSATARSCASTCRRRARSTASWPS